MVCRAQFQVGSRRLDRNNWGQLFYFTPRVARFRCPATSSPDPLAQCGGRHDRSGRRGPCRSTQRPQSQSLWWLLRSRRQPSVWSRDLSEERDLIGALHAAVEEFPDLVGEGRVADPSGEEDGVVLRCGIGEAVAQRAQDLDAISAHHGGERPGHAPDRLVEELRVRDPVPVLPGVRDAEGAGEQPSRRPLEPDHREARAPQALDREIPRDAEPPDGPRFTAIEKHGDLLHVHGGFLPPDAREHHGMGAGAVLTGDGDDAP